MGSVDFAARVKEEHSAPHHSYAIYDGNKLFNGGCYGVIHEDAEDEDLGVTDLAVFHIMNPNFRKDLYDFFMSDIMFGNAFVSTDLDKGLEQGWDLNTSYPYQFVLGAMIALRYTFNVHSYALGAYDLFRKIGATAPEAYLLSSYLCVEGTISLRGHWSDHIPVGGNINFTEWLENPSPITTSEVPTKRQAYFDWDDFEENQCHTVWHMWDTKQACLKEEVQDILRTKVDKTPYEQWGKTEYRVPATKENLEIILKSLRNKESK